MRPKWQHYSLEHWAIVIYQLYKLLDASWLCSLGNLKFNLSTAHLYLLIIPSTSNTMGLLYFTHWHSHSSRHSCLTALWGMMHTNQVRKQHHRLYFKITSNRFDERHWFFSPLSLCTNGWRVQTIFAAQRAESVEPERGERSAAKTEHAGQTASLHLQDASTETGLIDKRTKESGDGKNLWT